MHGDPSAEIISVDPRWLPAIALLAMLVAPSLPAAAETPSEILDEVRTMLEAGMSEPIILKWLDGSDHRPRRPSAADLIGLKQAGASDELLARLLELAGEASALETRPAAQPRVDAAPTSAPAPAPVESPAATPSVKAPSEASASANSSADVAVYFELSYQPDFDEDEDEWGLYVYIDGEPLTYVPAGSFLSAKPLRFRQFFAPGKHTLRVAQEQHAKLGPNRWFHAARVTDTEFPLQLEAGARADVELEFRQAQLAFGRSEGPVSFRRAQGRSVEEIEKTGGDPENWPLVCEEIEANAPEGKEFKKSLRRQLEGCVRWSELWGGLEVPSRDEVREALALFRYRPIPKDQPLD